MNRQIRRKLRNLAYFILSRLAKKLIYSTYFGGVKIKRQGGLGFLSIRNLRKNHSFKKEEQFLYDLALRDRCIYDIGSHIGIFTIFFAKYQDNTNQVIAFEPNPEIYAQLDKNISLNNVQNIQTLNIGIGDEEGMLPLATRRYETNTASIDREISNKILKERKSITIPVKVMTLDGCIEKYGLPQPDFIKIDIEGMEYNALVGMSDTIKKKKPQLYIEIHGALDSIKKENIEKIYNYLNKKQYSIYHVETQSRITKKNLSVAKKGHIFCTANPDDVAVLPTTE